MINKKGFTLMELLIVVIMISGFVVIAYPTYTSSIERARASEAVTMLGAIKAAQEKNYVMYEEYATNFKEIRDFTPAVSTDEADDPSFRFNLDSNNFRTEYFKYTMTSEGAGVSKKYFAKAERITANGQLANKGYGLTAYYNDDFISCNGTTDDGRKICASLTDQEGTNGSYKIY